VEPAAERLVMYGRLSDVAPLEWSWVHDQLAAAGTYWITTRGEGHPHPRPVWGVWDDGSLHLSVGSPVVARDLDVHPDVTVHLDSGTDVVIVEGRVAGRTEDPGLLARYDRKYDWTYTIEEYGPLTTIAATSVMAWRSAGWAGREGFQQTGRWRY
jgi:hypothetical protein